MSMNELLQWWNIIYTIPLVVSLVWIVATIMSGAHVGGDSHGHDGLGHAHHMSHDGAAHAHADSGDAQSHAGHSHDSHDHHGHEGSGERDGLGAKVSMVLGIGQIPVTLMIGLFLLSFGAFGLCANQFFAGTLKYPAVYMLPSLAATLVVSSMFTRLLSAILGRIMPSDESFAVSRLDLVGSLGRTVYSTSESAGTVAIRDTYGNLHRVQAKTEAGSEPVPAGAEVMVIDFDEEDKRFVVRISNL